MAVELAVDCVGGEGLQDSAYATKLLFMLTSTLSRPTRQVGLFATLPPMVFAWVTESWCPAILLVHVALEWPIASTHWGPVGCGNGAHVRALPRGLGPV